MTKTPQEHIDAIREAAIFLGAEGIITSTEIRELEVIADFATGSLEPDEAKEDALDDAEGKNFLNS